MWGLFKGLKWLLLKYLSFNAEHVNWYGSPEKVTMSTWMIGKAFFFSFLRGCCAFWNKEWHKELTEESEGHVQHCFPLAEVRMLVQKWPQRRCLCGRARWLGSCGENVWGGKGPGQVCGLRRLAWLGVRTVYYRMIDGENGIRNKLYFLGLQNHCRDWLQPWN